MPTRSPIRRPRLAARLAQGALAAVLAAGLLLGGCGRPAPKPTGVEPQAKAKPAAPQDMGAAQADLYTYEPADKPDPFRPFGVNKVKTLEQGEGPAGLCGMEVDQLKLVGIAKSPEGSMALVQDSAGRGYILTPGMAVGDKGGIVRQIDMDGVSVEQTSIDYAGRQRTQIVMIKMVREE